MHPEGSMDASNIIKPALSRGELQCIGATTMEEYRKYIEKDNALERRFQQVQVEPPSVDDSILILRGIRHKYEEHHKVEYSDEALVSTVKLSDRYITEIDFCQTKQLIFLMKLVQEFALSL